MGFQLRITARSGTLCESGAFTCQLASAPALPVTSEFSGCAVFHAPQCRRALPRSAGIKNVVTDEGIIAK